MENKWLNKTAYPFTAQYFSIHGYRMHYIDEGMGETILFVHGTPSWSFDFRNLIKRLQTSYRCIAIDHIGFGLSDKPEYYDYSTQHHSEILEAFILEKQLENITLVVHDFGGPIGMNVAIRHSNLIKRIVILNSWLWSSEHDPDFIRMRRILKSPLLPFLYRYLNFSPRFILPNSFGDHRLPKHLISQFTRPFADKTQRNGAVAFAQSLLNDQDWFESLWQKRQAIAHKPLLLIWGMKDPFLKHHLLEKFEQHFRHHTSLRLETAGHFPQEEQPEAVAAAIDRFMH